MFGTGKIAESCSFYLNKKFSISAYVCDKEFMPEGTFLKKTVVTLESLVENYPPSKYSAFVAIGYQELNSLREQKVKKLKKLGYNLVSYCPKGSSLSKQIGYNSIVMDEAVIQPYAKVGNNVFVWGGAMVGHHSLLKDHSWLSGSCAVGGGTIVGENSFIGLNSTIGNSINVGQNSIIGSGSICNKSIPSGTVLITPDTQPYRLNSNQFTRFSSEFNCGN